MFSRDWRVRIEDIVEALDRIRHYSDNLDEAAFCTDERTVDAVVRNLEIVGEAAHRVPAQLMERHPEVPWHRMAEMRNVLIHEYHSVGPAVIWSTVRHDLPPLYGPLKAILRQADPA